MEIKQVTIQLQDLKNDVTSNQVIRTSTQFNISKNLCNEINSILTIYRKRNVINKKKELMLNQEIGLTPISGNYIKTLSLNS